MKTDTTSKNSSRRQCGGLDILLKQAAVSAMTPTSRSSGCFKAPCWIGADKASLGPPSYAGQYAGLCTERRHLCRSRSCSGLRDHLSDVGVLPRLLTIEMLSVRFRFLCSSFWRISVMRIERISLAAAAWWIRVSIAAMPTCNHVRVSRGVEAELQSPR